MRVIGKGLIGWGQRSHGIEGGLYFTRQSPKGLLLREGQSDAGQRVGGAQGEARACVEPSPGVGQKETRND
jgi:hypothetical protein